MMTKEIVYFARAGAGIRKGSSRPSKKGAGTAHRICCDCFGHRRNHPEILEALKGTGVKLVSVCEHAGYDGGMKSRSARKPGKIWKTRGSESWLAPTP